jgi:hypothetical protein
MENFLVNIALPAAIILALVAVGLFVASLLVGIFQNLRGSIKLLIGLGVIIATYFISYAIASDVNPTNIPMSAGAVKTVSAGIYTMFTLIILAIAATIGTSIYNAIK